VLELDLDANDEPDFVHAVEAVVLGVLSVAKPREAYLVKVDSWFGEKWLAFSHKELGALAIISTDLRIPPFVPSRVVHERYFVRDDERDDYVSAEAPLALHVRQPSRTNAGRRITSLCPDAALFWWSGSTRTTGRGALMAYVPSPPRRHAYWYAELTGKTGWSSGIMRGITAKEIAGYQAVQSSGGPTTPSTRPVAASRTSSRGRRMM
jgi:hypothetical protein